MCLLCLRVLCAVTAYYSHDFLRGKSVCKNLYWLGMLRISGHGVACIGCICVM